MEKHKGISKLQYSRYVNYLKTAEWKAKRLQKAVEANYTCERCGRVCLNYFQIHHKTYKHLYNEPMEDLMFVCNTCHLEIHNAKHKALLKPKTNYQAKIQTIIATPQPNNLPKKKNHKYAQGCYNCKYSKQIAGKHEKREYFVCTLQLKQCRKACKKYVAKNT